MDDTAGDPTGAKVGTWAGGGAYYADWCGKNEVTKLDVGAVQRRATEGGGIPIEWGPPAVGGLYELDIQETPSADCVSLPWSLAPDQVQTLDALKNDWANDASVRQNLNVVLGDYVEDIPLLQDALAMDETIDTGPPYEVAFQANTGNLWSAGLDNHEDWGRGMAAGTSPAIAELAGGGYEIAFQANTGSLWTIGTAGEKNWDMQMAPGTSPAITALQDGGYEIAFQADTHSLITVGQEARNFQIGMAPGTSPSITRLSLSDGSEGSYEVAVQADTGSLWTTGSGPLADNHGSWNLGMAPGTSPSITYQSWGTVDDYGYEVAFQTNTGNLVSVGYGPGGDNHGIWYGTGGAVRVVPGTSPAITVLPGGSYEMAYASPDANGDPDLQATGPDSADPKAISASE